MTKNTLRLVTLPPPPSPELEDMSKAELAGHLRDMMAVTKNLCDTLDRYLGPAQPARRPDLHILPGGKSS